MIKKISKLYKDHENQPYISQTRDLTKWENAPEEFPYSLVPEKNMVLLKEKVFPGDIIMLWRISLNTFTNHSIIPQYFEYRYGIESEASIKRLMDKNYIGLDSLKNSLEFSNSGRLKKILKLKGIKVSGKKQELVDRVCQNFKEEELEKYLDLKAYRINNQGSELLSKYQDIIEKHGPKNL